MMNKKASPIRPKTAKKPLEGYRVPFSRLLRVVLGAGSGEGEKIPVGGQAVIEGVLMKGPTRWGLAVRRPDGVIFRESWVSSSRTKHYPWKLPLLRGFMTMAEMMVVGFRALGRSAEVALEESGEEMTKKDLFIAVIVGIAAVVGLFIALPLWLSDVATRAFTLSDAAHNGVEGVFRGLMFVGYVALIGLWGDIQEVFRYHGAEHKTINAFEKNLELTPKMVAAQSRVHPRCGTSFLLIAILIGIVVFSVAGKGGILWRVGSRVALLPLVIGVSYEFIRLAAWSGLAGKILIFPMLCLQYLTTREPGLRQIEVALASLEEAMKKDESEV
ncbi:MAG: DUF1385 domain-containing protein [Synergistaceae bacterium]|jgi:uncharacterized protein YqhQ|nr:DUF1385 domain-containing protein [Synergistaceae bacterium]